MYLNGILVDYYEDENALGNPSSNLYVGGGVMASGTDDLVEGSIYSVRIYNRALLATEIANNYAIDACR